MTKYAFSTIDKSNFVLNARLLSESYRYTMRKANKAVRQNCLTSNKANKFWPISSLDFLINRLIESKISLELASKFGRQLGKRHI